MGTGVKSDTARALLDRGPGPGAPASEIQVCDWSYEDYCKKHDELWCSGWRPKLLNVVP